MRFTAYQDYQTILKLNKELVNTVIDTPVIIYKVQVRQTKMNIYGEGTSKEYYTGVLVPCLINRIEADATSDVGVVDVVQDIQCAFLRTTLDEKNVYPEIGDIIKFDTQYYEINRTNEVQLYAGHTIYNHQILCDGHLMRNVPVQLQSTIL